MTILSLGYHRPRFNKDTYKMRFEITERKFSMSLSRTKQQIIGWIAIAFALGAQLFNDLTCYHHSLLEAITFLWFPGIALIPAIVFVYSPIPIRALGAALTAAAFYGLAYYTDCVRPYQGGGASMVYVVVIMYGTPLAVGVGLLVGWLFNYKKAWIQLVSATVSDVVVSKNTSCGVR